MDVATKEGIMEVLFPIATLGITTEDDHLQFRRIAKKLMDADCILECITRQEVLLAERNGDRLVLKTTKELRDLLRDAKWLLHYLERTNKQTGHYHVLQKPFLSKDLKRHLYVCDTFYYMGAPCYSQEKLKIAINYLTVLNVIKRISEIWDTNEKIADLSLLENYYFFKQLNNAAQEIITCHNKKQSVLDYLLVSGLI